MPRGLSIALILFAATARADDPSYARQVRPILAKYCSECHNARKQKGGLDLETMKAIRDGGDNGPVLVPGKAKESKLVVLMEGAEKPIMPPAKITVRPTKQEIAIVRAWVDAGAKDDGNVKVVLPNIKPKVQTKPPITGLWPAGIDSWHVARGSTLSVIGDGKRGGETGHSDPITALAVGDRWTVTALGTPGKAGSLVIELNDGSKAFATDVALDHRDVIGALAERDGLIVTGGYDSRVYLVRIDDFKVTQKTLLKDHSDSVHGVAIHPSGKWAASCSADRTVKIWDVVAGKLAQTLSDATDWLYAIAWSPDGKLIAAGGVDKSIRLYQWKNNEAKLVGSTFAHEGPVLKLAFSPDGRSLFSLGQDRIVKSWNPATLKERQIFARLPEDGSTLAVAPDGKKIAVGRHDGEVQYFDVDEPQADAKVDDPFPKIEESGKNETPARGQEVPLPARIEGTLDRAGDVDYYQFTVKKGQQFGAEVILPKGSKIASQLQLADLRGNVLVESDRGFVGHVFAEAGTYAIGVRDRELRGNKDFTYALRVGDVPVVTSFFPLGGQRGSTVPVTVKGVFLDQASISVAIPKDAELGSKVPVPVTSKRGGPRGVPQLVVGEFPEVNPTVTKWASDDALVSPATVNGAARPNTADRWSFAAKKGQRLLLEVNARRLGSLLDSIIEIRDAKNQLVDRAVLRCSAKTNVTFRDHDSANNSIRIETWNELGVNDLTYLDGELLKIRGLPGHPDADCSFFNVRGKRIAFLDTTPIHHANGAPLYKVSVHPPGTTFPANGFPVFTIPYRNDDGGHGFDRDSRLFFDPPADGTYTVVIRDVRNLGGPEYPYRLTIRPPRPSFTVSMTPAQPSVPRGAAAPLNLAVERLDGYDGPIDLRFENLPKGLHVPPTRLDAEIWNTVVPLDADADAKVDDKTTLTLVGSATIDGKRVESKATSGALKLTDDAGDLAVATDEKEVVLKPGGTASLRVRIERRKDAKGRVPFEVRGLPHGVIVLDIGLNGILINEGETERTIVFAAEPWVEAGVRPMTVVARSEEKKTEHVAKTAFLKIGK